MRITGTRDLGLYLRDRRRALRMTQAQTAAAAGVSQRWLASMEAGKPTAEIGLVFRVLGALRLATRIEPTEELSSGDISLDQLISRLGLQNDGA